MPVFTPLLLGGLLLLLAVGLTGGALRVTSTPGFCSRCHEMRPEYYTWEASDHRKVACVTCHIPPGLSAYVKHKLSAVKQVYYHFTGNFERPIHWPEPDSSTCLQCHQPDRERKGELGLHLAHGIHNRSEVTCVECHQGVAHGTIAERGLTAAGDDNQWNLSVGKAQMIRPNRVSGEQQCLDCHEQAEISAGCGSCHTGPVRPRNHGDSAWVADAHGQLARIQLGECKQCHSAAISLVRVQNSDSVTAYARDNLFCQSCHSQRPLDHGADWSSTHGLSAASAEPGCLVCHNGSRPLARDRAAYTYCAQCHAGPLFSPGSGETEGDAGSR